MQNVFIRKSLADKTVKLIGYLSCIACIYRISYQKQYFSYISQRHMLCSLNAYKAVVIFFRKLTRRKQIYYLIFLVSPRNKYFDYFFISPFESLLKCWKILKVLKSLRFHIENRKLTFSGEREKILCDKIFLNFCKILFHWKWSKITD